MDAVRLTTTPGYIACACCGQDIIGIPGDKCDGCRNGDGEGAGEGCDPATTWHCFTAHCDGTGCTYPGECEETEEDNRCEGHYDDDHTLVSDVATGEATYCDGSCK